MWAAIATSADETATPAFGPHRKVPQGKQRPDPENVSNDKAIDRRAAVLESVRSWVEHLLAGVLDARKRKTISLIVSGIVQSQSVVPAVIAREMPGDVADKHKIKRVDRYIGNTAIDVRDISLCLLRAYDFQPGQRVLLALDWTKIGKYQALTTSVVAGGRAVPFHWTIIDQNKTRMAIAQKWHIEELKSMLPDNVFFVCLFDAGFDDVEFLQAIETFERESLRFVIRSSTQVCLKPGDQEWIAMYCFKFVRGQTYDWGQVAFTKEHAYKVRVVGVHDPGQKDPWLLLTNLQDKARDLITMYGRRFETEETYKDFKDVRHGLQLKGQRIKSADRLSRLFAVEVIAYWLMVMAGLHGESLGLHRPMQANSIKTRRVLALWRVGRFLLCKGKIGSEDLLHYLWAVIDRLSLIFGGAKCRPSG